MKKIFALPIMAMLFVGCGASSDSSDSSDSSNSAAAITISGQIAESSSLAASSLREAKALDDYTFYCVAFNANADSCSDQLDSAGNFECTGIPADTAFGCFVKDATSIVATLEFADSGEGFNNESTSSVALGQSAALGTVTLNTTTGKASVSKSVIADKVSKQSSKISIDDIHNTAWTLSCVDGDDAEMNTICDEFIDKSPTVFLRLLKATKGSDNVYGIGVWASQAAFQGCGSKDMTEAMQTGIQDEDGISFTQNEAGPFANNAETCATDTETHTNPNDSEDATIITSYYALSKLRISGNSFSLIQESQETESDADGEGNPCTYDHTTFVTFSPSSATEMYGAFEWVDRETGAGCPGDEEVAKFTVKFTKQ